MNRSFENDGEKDADARIVNNTFHDWKKQDFTPSGPDGQITDR